MVTPYFRCVLALKKSLNRSFTSAIVLNTYDGLLLSTDKTRLSNHVDILKQSSYYSTELSEENHRVDERKSLRLSKLIALGTATSRRNAEILIRRGKVKVSGHVIFSPTYLVELPYLTAMVASKSSISTWLSSTIQVSGYEFSSTHHQKQNIQKLLSSLNGSFDIATDSAAISRTRVWLVHKLKGELVTENDPLGRPSMMERLRRGGVGKASGTGNMTSPLIPIGRLDMNTEGLVVITNDGFYAREMEVPKNNVHRIYRARVHGLITDSKVRAIRNGLEIDGIWYRGMQVSIQRPQTKRQKTKTNSWLQITCQEGKNRQIRKIMEHLKRELQRVL